MPRAAREYISLEVSGDYAEDLDRIRTIEQAILAAFGERVAYQILRLSTVERIEEEPRDAESILGRSSVHSHSQNASLTVALARNAHRRSPMWLEAIFSRDDLATLVARITPLKIRLGDGGEGGDFEITETADVTLVPDLGLRVACKAKLHWPVLGIHVPVTLSSVILTLTPEIVNTAGGDTLVFKVHIEHTDVAGLPTVIDEHITAKVNQELAEKHVELSWDFTKTLSHVFELPQVLRPIEALALTVAWGKTRITSDALVLVVSFHSEVIRDGAPRPREATPVPPVLEPPPAPKTISGSERRQLGFAVAALALAVGGAFAVARSLFGRRDG